MTPLALGIELAGGSMSVVLAAHTRVPSARTRTFDISDENREAGGLRLSLFEGPTVVLSDPGGRTQGVIIVL